MTALNNSTQNHHLATMPINDFRRMPSHLHRASIPFGKSFYKSSVKPQHAFLPSNSPTTSSMSLRYDMGNGATAEITGVLNENMLGISVYMGGKALPMQVIVRTVGLGYRLKGKFLLEMPRLFPVIHRLIVFFC